MRANSKEDNVCCKWGINERVVPAKVQQRACGGWYTLRRPAQEVELGESARLLCLHVFQVKAPDQKVITPDVLRHEIHLCVILH